MAEIRLPTLHSIYCVYFLSLASLNELNKPLANFLGHLIKLTLKCLVKSNLTKKKLNILFINIHLFKQAVVDLPATRPEYTAETQIKAIN